MTDKNIRAILDSMTIEEKVGQLFILAFPGKDAKPALEMINEFGIGGCYISQDNSETFEEAEELSSLLQKTALEKNPRLPMILGVDQEGAWGILVPDSVIGPGNLALGSLGDTDLTEAMYGIYAREMLSVGYQTILGPCADVNLNPQNPIIGTRSFGEDPKRVALHVGAAVRALKENGAVATAKHFPGHGDTHSDSHRDIPSVDKPLETLLENELLPFQAAVDADVDMIMTAHILYPQIDQKYPATLSSLILTDLLRKKMGFQGVIITDSMNMGAIKKHFSPKEAAVRSLIAGSDLIMLSEEHYDHNAAYLKNQKDLVRDVVEAFKSGELSEELLDQKLERIFRLKLSIGEKPNARVDNLAKTLERRREIERRAAFMAIRVLQNANGVFPLKKDQSLLVVNATPVESYRNLTNARGIGPNQAETAFNGFSDRLSAHWENIKCETYESFPEADLERYDAILAVTEDYPLPGEDFEKEKQIARIQKLIEGHNGKLMVVGLRSPYDLPLFPNIGCHVCSYSSRTCSAKAMADFLAVSAV